MSADPIRARLDELRDASFLDIDAKYEMQNDALRAVLDLLDWNIVVTASQFRRVIAEHLGVTDV